MLERTPFFSPMHSKMLFHAALCAAAFGVTQRICALPIDPVVAVAPTISAQPVDQTVTHGGDVALTVQANGDGLRYEWRKDGAKLHDYGNVAGAHTSALYLIGASQADAGSYKVIVYGNSGVVTSAVSVVKVNLTSVFEETFETGVDKWKPALDSAPLSLDDTRNHTQGGRLSFVATNSAQRSFARLNKLTGRVRLSFWMYDDGTDKFAAGDFRAHNGPEGYAKYSSPFALEQSLAIGLRSPVGIGARGGGTLGELLDRTKYQGRVLRGTNSGWFNLTSAPSRSVGWHQFTIERQHDGTLLFSVDGVLGRRIKGAKNSPLDTVMLGDWGAYEGNGGGNQGATWFDDVQVDAFPLARLADVAADGSPIPKLMQLKETGVADVSSLTPITVAEAAGSQPSKSLGKWDNDETDIVAHGLRGYLEYPLSAPAADVFRLEIEGKSSTNGAPVNIWCDGEFLGRFNLPSAIGSNTFTHCFTPYLAAGPHTFGIEWDNGSQGEMFAITAVRLQQLRGGSTAANGLQTWVANRVQSQSGADVLPNSSLISPVCIEGRSRYFGNLSVSAGTDSMKPIVMNHGAGYRWYANVPLSSSNVTQVQISYQNGALTESNTIAWQVTDLLNPTTNQIVIRKGDSLLFNACPAGQTNGAVTITVGGVTQLTTDASTPVPFKFETAGTFVVSGTYGGNGLAGLGANGGITVTVVDASLDACVPVFGWRSHWDCTNLPPSVVLQVDPRLKLGSVRLKDVVLNGTDSRMPTAGSNTRSYRVWSGSPEPEYVVARVGKDGPIIATTMVQGMEFHMPSETLLTYVSTRDDGSDIIDGEYALSPVIPGISVNFHIATGGVTFDDGTINKTLNASDFSDAGACHLRFIRAAGHHGSICNMAKIYYNGVLINRK
jgi:hypothetical protein